MSQIKMKNQFFGKIILLSSALTILSACGGGSGGGNSGGGNSATSSATLVGQMDTSFAGTGIVLSHSPASAGLGDNLLVFLDGSIGQVSFPATNSDTDLQTIQFTLDGTQQPANSLGALSLTACKSFFSSGSTASCVFGPSLVQADGKIIQTMKRQTASPTTYTTVLIRFNADGSIDSTFGTNGVAEYSAYQASSAPVRVLQQKADGKLLVLTKLITEPGATSPSPTAFPCVLRFNTNGTLDTPFASSGVAKMESQFSDGKNWVPYAMDLDNSLGQIYVAGERFNGTYGTEAFVIRLNTDGTFDSNYGPTTGPYAKLGSASAIYGGNDQIDIAFESTSGELYVAAREANNQTVYMTKMLSNGSIDTSFGTSGQIATPVSIYNAQTSYYEQYSLQRMHMGPDGMLYVLGSTSAYSGYSTNRVVVFRLESNGTLDTSFGGATGWSGLFTTDTNMDPDVYMSDFRFTQDGRIVMGGYWMGYGSSNSYSTAVIVLD